MALIVNLYGAPGAGKSTGAAYVFARIKDAGINAELVTEFAKGKVWEGNTEVFKNQAYIFGKQFYSISRCEEKVDVIITDSPLMLSCFYNNDERLGECFNDLVKKVALSYNSLNYLIYRTKAYNPKGRMQTAEESDALKVRMKEMLDSNNIKYNILEGKIASYERIIRKILKICKEDKNERG